MTWNQPSPAREQRCTNTMHTGCQTSISNFIPFQAWKNQFTYPKLRTEAGIQNFQPAYCHIFLSENWYEISTCRIENVSTFFLRHYKISFAFTFAKCHTWPISRIIILKISFTYFGIYIPFINVETAWSEYIAGSLSNFPCHKLFHAKTTAITYGPRTSWLRATWSEKINRSLV